MFFLAAYPTLLAILIGTATLFHFTHTGNRFTHTPGRRCHRLRRCAYCTRVLVARQFMQSTHVDSLFPGALGLGMSDAAPYDKELAPVPGHPKAIDVLVVKAILTKATNFPPEILDMIIDHAEYWPCSETFMDYTGANKVRISAGRAGHAAEDRLLLRTPPVGFTTSAVADLNTWNSRPAPTQPLTRAASPEQLMKVVKTAPALTNPVRKVVFKLRSSDQGWGGERENHGTFQRSWTWFEAGLEKIEASDEEVDAFRPEHLRPVYPLTEEKPWGDGTRTYVHQLHANQKYKIQCNRTCTRGVNNYEITWRWTDNIEPDSPAAEELAAQGRGTATGSGEFVRSLQLGDVITVWGKSRFPGWANNVETVAVEVYWAI
ncbi:hypothetical protein ACHAQH_005777 [Verticillium albo-atrum]